MRECCRPNSISKIAAEAVAAFCAREWKLPTTIARLNVPYGDEGGWPFFHLLMMQAGQPIPVHEKAPSSFKPIHEDDIVPHGTEASGGSRNPGDHRQLGWS